MAKVHLKLDKRKNCRKKDGSYPVILSLHHQSKSRPIGLKYSFTPHQWNEKESCPINIPEAKHIKAKLEFYLMKAQVFLNERLIEIELWSIQELKTRLQAEIFSSVSTSDSTKMRYQAKKNSHISLTEYAQERIDLLRESRKNGNADAIEGAMNRLKAYSGTDSISFAEVDERFLEGFCAYCYSRGNKASTISVYLRPIRKLFNDAVGSKLIDAELFPFNTFKIPKAGKTKNRALRTDDIGAIRSLELRPNSAIWNARNYFLFMFNNMGINFIDLVKLKKSQVISAKYDSSNKLLEGRISFDRSKTSNAFSIKLTQESINILNQYDIGNKSKDDFIFPYGYEETERGRKRYKQHRKRLNRKLKELADLAEIDEPLTTYYARHSWATIAKRKKVPVAMISEALGHKDLKTTQIYLDSFDNEDMDALNDSITSD
ncbi:MAG: phage integrase SAM-like domain-containing protein [Fluviicola sp.]